LRTSGVAVFLHGPLLHFFRGSRVSGGCDDSLFDDVVRWDSPKNTTYWSMESEMKVEVDRHISGPLGVQLGWCLPFHLDRGGVPIGCLRPTLQKYTFCSL
jgi:hypothetical protein